MIAALPKVIPAMSHRFLGTIIAVLSLAVAPLSRGEPAAIGLKDLSGKLVEPLAKHGQKATVLFFLTTECPIGNLYSPEISRIVRHYKEQGVTCHAVYAHETSAEITKHRREYKLSLGALLDPELKLAKLTGATVTPEACILSPDGKVLYRGRIDDRAVKFGTVRLEPRVRDLRLAWMRCLPANRSLKNSPSPSAVTFLFPILLSHPLPINRNKPMNLAQKSASLLCLLLSPLQGAEEEKPVTFSKDIAPIIFENCTACHRPGQIGPFALTDYKTVKRRAKQIVEVTEDRTMPPWHADPGDVKFSNDRSLSSAAD